MLKKILKPLNIGLLSVPLPLHFTFHNFHPVIIKYSIAKGPSKLLIILLKRSRFVT